MGTRKKYGLRTNACIKKDFGPESAKCFALYRIGEMVGEKIGNRCSGFDVGRCESGFLLPCHCEGRHLGKKVDPQNRRHIIGCSERRIDRIEQECQREPGKSADQKRQDTVFELVRRKRNQGLTRRQNHFNFVSSVLAHDIDLIQFADKLHLKLFLRSNREADRIQVKKVIVDFLDFRSLIVDVILQEQPLFVNRLDLLFQNVDVGSHILLIRENPNFVDRLGFVQTRQFFTVLDQFFIPFAQSFHLGIVVPDVLFLQTGNLFEHHRRLLDIKFEKGCVQRLPHIAAARQCGNRRNRLFLSDTANVLVSGSEDHDKFLVGNRVNLSAVNTAVDHIQAVLQSDFLVIQIDKFLFKVLNSR